MSSTAPHTRDRSGGSVRSGSRRFKGDAAGLAPPIATTEAGPSTQRRVRTVPRTSLIYHTTTTDGSSISSIRTYHTALTCPSIERLDACGPITATGEKEGTSYST